MSPATTPSHLTTNPVTTTALITSLSRRSLSLSRHRPTTPVTTKDGEHRPTRYGIDISYTKWTKHGEEDKPLISTPKPVNATTELVNDIDFAYIPTDGPTIVEMVNATKDNFDVDDLVKFQELLLDAEKPLYEGCPDFTKLSAIVKLLNLKGKYGASDKFFTELLGLIKKMLPVDSQAWRTIDEKYNHPFRKQKKAFNGQQEFLQAPILMTGEQIYNENVAESIVGTLLHVPGKTKDGLNARLDLAELGVKPELFAMQDKDKTTLPPAGYTLMNAEKDIFCETLHNIKVPEGYCSNFSSLVNLKDRKLIGLKLHDYHMLMQDKEIILQELDKMQAELVVTLCLLEKFFPPSFFDIMIHLTVHLTREVKLCGPICFRWMYPFQRCMKVIKGHVRNKNKPEGCIAEETIAEETIEFFSEYHKSMETIGIPPDKHETYENEEGKPLSAGKSSEVSAELFQKAHLYVIQNTDEIVPYIEYVERELAIDKESVSKTVRWISYGPRATVVKYDAYNINGYTFRTKCHDGKVYQNSRVSVEAIDLHISKEVATTRQAYYYGVLQEIWVLDYRFRQIPLFKCDWVNHKSGGVKRDKLGYTLVDLNNLGHKVDPFVLASQALQVFYVKDPVDKKLSIVFKTPPKNYKDTYDEVDEEFSTVIHHRNDNVLPLVDRRDLANESRDDYYRKDCGENIVVNLDSSSDNNNSDSYSTSQISTSEEIDYDSPEPPKSLLKWYHYLSDEYKDNGRFWGSKSGCNESDVKPYWKDIKKAKACMLAKAQASDASSKAKVEACGQDLWSEDTMTFAEEKIGKRKLRKIIDISSDSSDDRRWAAKKASAPVFYGPSTQGLLDAYGCDTIEEYLEWNYFPSTDNESTNMETTHKGNTDMDCIDNSNFAMSKGCVLGLASVTTWDEIEKKMGARKSKTYADKANGKQRCHVEADHVITCFRC
ncbi:putative transposon, En/Spm-like protein [Tanacetum coccineum]|uniref:Transposon, En/Spm-like protein n=1 Tax=Tanacetum coccineum TaxID=301880 RepID=A0ABQ4XIW9_9ASTR